MHITIIFCVLVGVWFEAIAYPNFQANDDGTVTAFVDQEDYENLEDAWESLSTQKRFWAPHRSDYNPMRRPVPVPRGSKRNNGVVNHPVARAITLNQLRSSLSRSQGDEYSDIYDFSEGGRQKKQTGAGTLLFRLGAWGLRGQRKPETNVSGRSQPPSS